MKFDLHSPPVYQLLAGRYLGAWQVARERQPKTQCCLDQGLENYSLQAKSSPCLILLTVLSELSHTICLCLSCDASRVATAPPGPLEKMFANPCPK